MLYIVRRTQLYLDEVLWKALHLRARRGRTTVSELVRSAARERYLGATEQRGRAMKAIVGLWSDRSELADPEAYVRALRRGRRIENLTRS